MTILNLTKGWLLRVATGETFGAQTDQGDRAMSFEVEGGVEKHAGGRIRAYSVEGEVGVFSRTFLELTWAQVSLLRTWQGEVVLYRDWRPGVSAYGTFFGVEPIETSYPTLYKAKISINVVSVLEGV